MAELPTCHCREGKPKEVLYEPISCTLESREVLTPSETQFRFVRDDGQPFGHKPGQFFQISVFGIGESPISVSSSPTRGNYLDFGVRKAGKLTRMLHDSLKPGDKIGVRGPFGTFFDVDEMKGKDLLLISGGCGLAPMRALIQYVEDCSEDFGKVTILYGAKSSEDLLYKEELAQWEKSGTMDCHYMVGAVSGGTCWEGKVGLVTELIPFVELNPKKTLAVIVGPSVMYRFVIMELHQKGLQNEDIIVSIERHMKCGVGKCGHCSIEHLYCCLDGPVFRVDQVVNLEGAL